MTPRKWQPPSRSLLALEPLALVEYGAFLWAAPLFAARQHGADHPILVLPGFTASDRSTRPLRALLQDKGFAVHGWGLGPNVGPHPHVLEGLHQRVLELYRRHGAPVSLIGWSLGGIYARELARAHPDRVRLVITLGSPYRFRAGDRGYASELYAAVAPQHDPYPGRMVAEEDRPPLPVPATSIYTRTDGIVHWRACIDENGPLRENIEVIGTHYGLGFNLAALVAITDRLNVPDGAWRPFVPPLPLRHLYPRPASWQRRPADAQALA
jgi:pimeloyl-ACP methyl ester carboxylesterase